MRDYTDDNSAELGWEETPMPRPPERLSKLESQVRGKQLVQYFEDQFEVVFGVKRVCDELDTQRLESLYRKCGDDVTEIIDTFFTITDNERILKYGYTPNTLWLNLDVVLFKYSNRKRARPPVNMWMSGWEWCNICFNKFDYKGPAETVHRAICDVCKEKTGREISPEPIPLDPMVVIREMKSMRLPNEE